MTWPNGTRYKTAAPGGSWIPADMNGVQDQLLQVAGYRGKSIIATEETHTNTAYGLLTTPDRVQGLVLPTDGLLFVAYQATWKESVSNAANAAIFLGANQIKVTGHNTAAPQAQAARCAGDVNIYQPLCSAQFGLYGAASSFATAYGGDVTTGQVIGCIGLAGTPAGEIDNADNVGGGVCAIFAAAGTYDISVQFKASSGSVTAKERKLWVWTEAFS